MREEAVRRTYSMERIVKLLCMVCGFICSDTMATQAECESSSDVRDLRPSGVSSSSITLRWEVPAGLCGRLVGYELRGWQTKNMSSSAVFGNYIPEPGQSATFDKLEPNAEYSFTVCALSTKPNGAPIESTLAKVQVTTDPGPVTGLTVRQQNTRSIKCTWNAPQNSKQFEVCVYVTPRDRNLCRIIFGEEYTITGLGPEITYSIEVTAVRMNASNTVEARGTTQTTRATTICEHSENVQLQQSLFDGGSSYILLAWTVPRKVCGAFMNISVSFFEKTAPSKGKSTEQHNFYDVLTTCANITALAANTIYNFTVAALTREPSGSDTSGGSHSVELKTAPARVNHLEQIRVTSDSFEVRWTAPHLEQDGALLYHLNLYSLSRSRELKMTTSNTTVKFDKLEPARAYRLEITTSGMLTAGTRIYGDFALMDIRTDCTSPYEPRMTIDAPTSNMDMRVSWQHDSSNCLNISYVIFVTFLNGSSHVETAFREFVIRDLQPYTNYAVVVSAVRTDGLNRRAYSNSSAVFVSTPAVGKSWSIWVSENGELSWAIAATVAAVASITMNVMFCACIHRLRYIRWRNGRLYKTKVCSHCSQMESTVKSVATTDAPAETMDPLVEHPYSTAAEIEARYASLVQSQRISRIYEPLSHSNFK